MHRLVQATASVRLHEGVGIISLRQRDHPHRSLLPQQLHAGLERRFLPGLVAVVQQEDVLRVAREQQCLTFSQRGAEARHGLRRAREVAANHVHVAFDHQRLIVLPQRILCPVQSIQQLALPEDRRVRRVQVFRLARPHQATAETDGMTGGIIDGEHHAVAETCTRLRLVLALHEQARIQQLLLVVAQRAELRAQQVRISWRVAHLETIAGHAIEAT